MAVIAVLVGSSLISGIGAPDEVDTGEAISDITSGNVCLLYTSDAADE